jgi:hypothetical protein
MLPTHIAINGTHAHEIVPAPHGETGDVHLIEKTGAILVSPVAVIGGMSKPFGEQFPVVFGNAGRFIERLEASVWELELPGVSVEVAQTAADALMAAEEVSVERLTKNGIRTFDARGPVLAVEVAERDAPAGDAPNEGTRPAGESGDCAIMRLVVRHVTPSVRPDDVLVALRHVANLVPPVPVRVTRLAQGPLVADVSGRAAVDAVSDPFAADRGEADSVH